MAWAETLEFRVVEPKKLRASQHADIDRLLQTSLRIDFPGRTDKEIAYLAAQSSGYRKDPNNAIGGTTLRNNQSFARAVCTLAVNSSSGELEGYLPAADNASSSAIPKVPEIVSDLIGAGIRQVKLHPPAINPYIEAHIPRPWLWLGICGLSKAARRNQAESDGTSVIAVDGLVSAAIMKRHDQQRIAAYPYIGEEAWMMGLQDEGFVLQRDSAMPITAFGPYRDGVFQERWTAASVESVREVIAAKDGAEQMLTKIYTVL